MDDKTTLKPDNTVPTPPAWGAALFSATLKRQPADFHVEEVLNLELQGSGEHLYVHLQKIGLNTDELVALLQKTYAVAEKDIGFSGMKDRHAVTSQWFSIVTPDNADKLLPVLESFNTSEKMASLLASSRHSRKLRRGTHQGNDFVITLRDVKVLDSSDQHSLDQRIAHRVDQIRRHGFPNYIGPQRFGFGAQNLTRARQWFRQPKKRTSRQQRSLWLSAARSAIFNAVCAQRVRDACWQTLLPGEPAMLEGSRSFFDSSDSTSTELDERLASFDIHPSAPWWGRGVSPAKSQCAEYEQAVLEPLNDLCVGLEKAGLDQERRAIRALAVDLSYRWLDVNSLELSFHLPPGVFATTLLRELGECHEPVRQ